MNDKNMQTKDKKIPPAKDIRLITLDMDGTLLNSDKQLTDRNRRALEAAAEAGIEIVPATGRFYMGLPEAVRSLPFIRYCIIVNGAQVVDIKTGKIIYSADISPEDAIAFYTYLDTLPVIYDCYIDGWGYMTRWMQEAAGDYISYIHSLKMVREL
ncbi:MAG: HAD family phosphatase, partial [Lachnospiraceae bacterium]|nr:HAD family phosphatase [Lachnospiraceae bacterium]